MTKDYMQNFSMARVENPDTMDALGHHILNSMLDVKKIADNGGIIRLACSAERVTLDSDRKTIELHNTEWVAEVDFPQVDRQPRIIDVKDAEEEEADDVVS